MIDDHLRDARDVRDYAEPAVLRDGGSLWIRAIRPTDKAGLVALFEHLSPRSRRLRFFGGKAELSPRELAFLTEVDFATHVALAAVLRTGDEERLIGVGRAIRDGARAELAFEVADEHQGRGIGTILLEHLAAIAHAQGVLELTAETLADNAAMIDVFVRSGFTVRQELERDVIHVTFPSAASAAFLAASAARDRHAAAESLRPFFAPRSVAVVGASRTPGSIGRAILANLRAHGFTGAIHPVNPRATELDGLPCAPSVAAIGAPVELAVIAVPAPAVEDVIADCARAGVKGVVVISAGFAEAGATGRAAQDRIRQLARSSGMRLVGPNCVGVLSTDPAIRLDASFAPGWPPEGGVSFLSQSGALALAMLDHASAVDLGIASFVSVGNKADVSGNDLLAYWAEDPRTRVIALYLESFGNPRKFARVAPEVARRKPIVAVKSGRSAAGTRAAASHTAALASLDVGVDALFAQAGVVRTDTIEQLFDVAALMSTQPVPRGPRVGVVTNAGGPGILFADACEAHGLVVPELSSGTRAALGAFLPPHAGLGNPVDMIASAGPDDYVRTIAAVAADPAIDSVVAIYIPPMVSAPDEIAAAIARAAGAMPADKPIAAVFMSSTGAPRALSAGPRGRIPSYAFPENAAMALAAAVKYGAWRARPAGEVLALPKDAEREIRRLVERAQEGATTPRWLAAPDVARVCALAGIELAPLVEVAADPEEAARASIGIGYPLVAKAVAPGLVHKSDVGGVVMGLGDAAAVRAAVGTLRDRLDAHGVRLDKVVLQRQLLGGVEALVGVTIDPTMGPLVAAGFGGVEAELARDVAFRLAPVSDVDAGEMLDGLRGARRWAGYRNAPPADRAALVRVIQRVSAVVDAIPELLDLELNPVIVNPPGQGAIAVDARIRIAPRGGTP